MAPDLVVVGDAMVDVSVEAGALARGWPAPEALRMACEAGARAVQREGPWP